MIVLSGADVVLADRVVSPATIIIEDDTIIDIEAGARAPMDGALHVALDGHVIVPGFIDVHVHGVAGHDVLDGPGAVRTVAELLPRWGVTAFCPTTVACSPAALSALFDDIAAIRTGGHVTGARVLPAHLESNFINPEYRGAQPAGCLRKPPGDPRALLMSRPEGFSQLGRGTGGGTGVAQNAGETCPPHRDDES